MVWDKTVICCLTTVKQAWCSKSPLKRTKAPDMMLKCPLKMPQHDGKNVGLTCVLNFSPPGLKHPTTINTDLVQQQMGSGLCRLYTNSRAYTFRRCMYKHWMRTVCIFDSRATLCFQQLHPPHEVLHPQLRQQSCLMATRRRLVSAQVSMWVLSAAFC